MEEAVWGNPQNESMSPEVSDSNSTSKTYQKEKRMLKWSEIKSGLNGTLNAVAILGWVVFLAILLDGFFLNGHLLVFLLIGK